MWPESLKMMSNQLHPLLKKYIKITIAIINRYFSSVMQPTFQGQFSGEIQFSQKTGFLVVMAGRTYDTFPENTRSESVGYHQQTWDSKNWNLQESSPVDISIYCRSWWSIFVRQGSPQWLSHRVPPLGRTMNSRQTNHGVDQMYFFFSQDRELAVDLKMPKVWSPSNGQKVGTC